MHTTLKQKLDQASALHLQNAGFDEFADLSFTRIAQRELSGKWCPHMNAPCPTPEYCEDAICRS